VQFEVLESAESQPSLERDLEETVVDAITATQIWNTLNPAEREVVFLWAVEGLSASEIADQLGEPRGTVLSRLRRLRMRVTAEYLHRASGGGQ
jgi:RNA polymerase sigma-70 factor, ECF subfamily